MEISHHLMSLCSAYATASRLLDSALAASICGETSISLPLPVPHRRLDDLHHLPPSGCGPFLRALSTAPEIQIGSLAANPPIMRPRQHGH